MAVILNSSYTDSPDAIWLKGNLHTHTTDSDGQASPDEMIARYAELGYDFLAISDHDTLGDVAEFDARGIVIIPAVEVCGEHRHILHVNAKSVIPASDDLQATIDAINASGGLAVLCHPNWLQQYDHFTYNQLLSLNGYLGIEIFNGTCINQPGNHLATDKWDRLLGEGKGIWGLASDDAHTLGQAGCGWVVAKCAERSVEAICNALSAGSFYCSSGVTIDEISCQGAELTVHSPDAQAMAVISDYSQRVYHTDGGRLEFDASEVAGSYIRVECYGRGGTRAWTQPIALTGGLLNQRKAKFASLDPTLRVGESSNIFVRLSDGEPSQVQTEVRCNLSDEKLIFTFDCAEPDHNNMRLNITRDGDLNTYNDDCIELFIDAEAKAAGYYQIMVSAAGYVCVNSHGDLPPIAGVEAVAGKSAGGWSLEITVPVDQLPGSASPGEAWGLHICRNRPATREQLIWNWTGSTNHCPRRFGRLIFP